MYWRVKKGIECDRVLQNEEKGFSCFINENNEQY